MEPRSKSPRRLTAYYKTTLGLCLLVGSCVGLGITLWLASKASILPLAALCIGGFIFGCYSLNRPYFLLEPRQLTVYNLLGLVSKRYTFESWEVVKADNRRIYIDNGGITIKVAVAPWLVKTDDWVTMRKML